MKTVFIISVLTIHILSMMGISGYAQSSFVVHADSIYHLALTSFDNSHSKKDSSKGISLLKKAATLGHYHSTDLLSNIYLLGRGANKNYSEARKWLQSSIQFDESGQPDFDLYVMYNIGGYGILKNADSSMYWLFESADKGYPEALYQTGAYYASIADTIVGQFETSFNYFQRAAQKGHARANYALAIQYLYGYGTEKDYYRAFSHLNLAAVDNHTDAYIKLADAYAIGMGVYPSLSKALLNYYYASFCPEFPTTSLDMYDSLCLKLFKKKVKLELLSGQINKYAENGLQEANLVLWYLKRNNDYGTEYLEKCLAKNMPEAQYEYAITLDEVDAKRMVYIERSAAQNYPAAIEKLGEYFYFEKDNCKKAVILFQKAIELNSYSESTYYNLGSIYLNDSCLEVHDLEKAFNCFNNPILSENNNAYYCKARMYEKGLGIAQNFTKAIENYERSLIIREVAVPFHFDLESKFHLGRLYYLGNGTKKNLELAAKYLSVLIGYESSYLKVREKDLVEAQYWLALLLKSGHGVFSETWIPDENDFQVEIEKLLKSSCDGGVAEACAALKK